MVKGKESKDSHGRELEVKIARCDYGIIQAKEHSYAA